MTSYAGILGIRYTYSSNTSHNPWATEMVAFARCHGYEPVFLPKLPSRQELDKLHALIVPTERLGAYDATALRKLKLLKEFDGLRIGFIQDARGNYELPAGPDSLPIASAVAQWQIGDRLNYLRELYLQLQGFANTSSHKPFDVGFCNFQRSAERSLLLHKYVQPQHTKLLVVGQAFDLLPKACQLSAAQGFLPTEELGRAMSLCKATLLHVHSSLQDYGPWITPRIAEAYSFDQLLLVPERYRELYSEMPDGWCSYVSDAEHLQKVLREGYWQSAMIRQMQFVAKYLRNAE